MHINIDKILLGIVARHFSQNFDGVTALDWQQNFVSAQYLENKLTECDQNLYLENELTESNQICMHINIDKI